MKYILIAAIALLALAQGNHAQDAVNLDTFTRLFEDLKTRATELINDQDLVNQAQTYMEPLVAKFENQVKTLTETLGDQASQVQPMLESIKAQVQEAIQNFQSPATGN